MQTHQRGAPVLHLLSEWIEIICRNKTPEGELRHGIVSYVLSSGNQAKIPLMLPRILKF
jgi:hypothetical protein